MPRVFPEYKEQASAKIVQSAISVFARKGYDYTTMEDIAKETGVSKSAIYTYFQSKEDILTEILKSGFETPEHLTLKTVLDGVLDESLDSSKILMELYKVIVEHPDMMRLAFDAIGSAPFNKKLRKVLRDDFERDAEAIRVYMQELISKGRIRPDADPRTFALLFETLNLGLVAGICAGFDVDELQKVWLESTKVMLKSIGLDSGTKSVPATPAES